MIPKKVHYCWFGAAQKSKLIEKCIASWRNNLPDYEIIEWNETNCDIENSCQFVKQAYAEKKWAYVSDYFRLKALSEHGGIYLDTDVEVIKPFDGLLENDFFCCFESEGYLCTAVLGSAPGQTIIENFLQSYEDREFSQVPNSKLLFDFLIGEREYDIDNDLQLDEHCVILSVDSFSPKDFYTKRINLTEKTYAVHHFDGTWKSKGHKFKDGFQNFLIKIIGKEKYFSLKRKVKHNDNK